MHPDERPVDADLLGGLRQLNGLQQRVSSTARPRPGHVPPVPKRKKPDLLHALSQRHWACPDSLRALTHKTDSPRRRSATKTFHSVVVNRRTAPVGFLLSLMSMRW